MRTPVRLWSVSTLRLPLVRAILTTRAKKAKAGRTTLRSRRAWLTQAAVRLPKQCQTLTSCVGRQQTCDVISACLPPTGIFCCYDDGILVGAVVYNQSEHGGGAQPAAGGPVTIGMLSVLPSHQRRGIARTL
jgi:ribosomal protein S18 acetylase RimI-like enzyme